MPLPPPLHPLELKVAPPAPTPVQPQAVAQLAAQQGHLVAHKRAFAAGPSGPGPPPGPARFQAGAAASPTAHPTRCCHRCRGAAASLPVSTPSSYCPPNAPPLCIRLVTHAHLARAWGQAGNPLQLGSSKWRGQGSGSGIRGQGQGQGWMTVCIGKEGRGPHSGGELPWQHTYLCSHTLNPNRPPKPYPNRPPKP